MIKVAKFGGSSLADALQFKKVKDIVFSDEERRIIVCSAPGKTNEKDNKITDLLYLLHAHLKYKVDYSNIYQEFTDKYYSIAEELGLTIDLEKMFSKLKEELNANISEDYLISRGEYYAGIVLANYLGYKFIDAKDIIIFNYRGNIDYEETSARFNKLYQEGDKIVVPGFYGSYIDGSIKTLSRGGSDITGAIMARCSKASIYENWTDVSGIYMADPKVILNPKKIKEVNYEELRELSYMGAKVIHEETIFPIQEMNIPIHILNTNDKDATGTIITNKCLDTTQIITGIAGKKGYISININTDKRVKKIENIQEVLRIFEKYRLNIEHIPTSIDSFCIIVAKEEIEKDLYEVLEDIKELDSISSVEVDNDIALVAIVGRNMALKPGISGKIFGLLGNNNINIKMISQASNEISIIVGVSNNDFEKTIKVIYEANK